MTNQNQNRCATGFFQPQVEDMGGFSHSAGILQPLVAIIAFAFFLIELAGLSGESIMQGVNNCKKSKEMAI